MAATKHSRSRARKIKNAVGKQFAMWIGEMKSVRLFLLLFAGLAMVPAFSMGARKPTERRQDRKDYKLPAQARSAIWDSSTVKARSHAEMKYLAATPPTGVVVVSKLENWDDAANTAASKKNLPVAKDPGGVHGPSFSGFLEALQAIEEADKLDKVTEDQGMDSDLDTGDSAATDVDPVTEEPGYPLPEEGLDEDDLSKLENGFTTEMEPIFPRPHEQFVSGGRLLMFFPVDHPSLDDWSSSPLTIPIDTSVSFQPPNANIPRSSTSIRKEN